MDLSPSTPQPTRPKLILASRSPRRRQLLAEAGYQFEVRPPDRRPSAGVCSGETRPTWSPGSAHQKAADVAAAGREGLVLGCDTVAECGGHPRQAGRRGTTPGACSRRSAADCTASSAGCVSGESPTGARWSAIAETTLRMDRLGEQQLAEYLSGGQWEGKAGAFGYQDRLGWIHVIAGSLERRRPAHGTAGRNAIHAAAGVMWHMQMT